MNSSPMNVFEQGMLVYPQPVALACGRICRARSPQEKLDAVLKCAEILTRYLAGVAISSFAARSDEAPPPGSFSGFSGNLSFGTFLSVVQGVAKSNANHPLRGALSAGFRKKGNQPASVDDALVHLLGVRNAVGHNLMSMSEGKASSYLAAEPDHHLARALEGAAGVLDLPLFVIEEQRMVKKVLRAHLLVLMGESLDPPPEEFPLNEGLTHDRQMYLGVGPGAFTLYPFLRWDLIPKRQNYGIQIIHAVHDDHVKYVTANDDSEESEMERAVVQERLSGMREPVEPMVGPDGSTLTGVWQERRTQRLQSLASTHLVPWADFDQETVMWYGQRLAGATSFGEACRAVRERLLDERDQFQAEEIRQLCLLFGTQKNVRKLLGREVIDCRARKDPEVRWDERVESANNVLQSLRQAIQFFGKHVGGVAGVNIDGLKATSGSADYIALREGLVNLFIHQDYEDPRTVSQVTITPEQTVLFNAGRSLVKVAALVDGGKSQSRNPLVSRAFRLIGFAELAGSGLQTVHRVWRKEKRRPPVCESDEANNTFTLTLDWRTIPDISDEFWKKRLGVNLSAEQARTLGLAAEVPTITTLQVASALGILVQDAAAVCEHLRKQGMMVQEEDGYRIQDHLRQAALEAGRSGQGG